MPSTATPLRLSENRGVLTVVLDNGPLNLLDATLMTELDTLAAQLEADDGVRVVVFDSADPDFFVAHGDMTIVTDPAPFAALPIALDQPSSYNPMMRLHERIRQLPQLTVGVLRGLARGGGAELLSALDVRFASLERGGLAQMEAATGIIPGAGGTAYLPPLVGRARTLEIILGGGLVDAPTAAAWGWVNRALPDSDLDAFVDDFARTVADLPPGVVAAALAAVNAATVSLPHALSEENAQLAALFARPAATTLTLAALAAGAQTREGERELESLLRGLPADIGEPTSTTDGRRREPRPRSGDERLDAVTRD